MPKKKITYDRLHEVLNYDPKTGIFRRRFGSRGAKKNSIAGSIGTDGYITIMIDYKWHKASRLAFLYMEGYMPEFDIDHINRIRSDNKWFNLRHVSRSCNNRNKCISKNNTSGVTGVSFNKKSNKWRSYIKISKKDFNLGLYNTILEAAKARWEAEKKYNWPNCNTTSSAFLYIKKHQNKTNKEAL